MSEPSREDVRHAIADLESAIEQIERVSVSATDEFPDPEELLRHMQASALVTTQHPPVVKAGALAGAKVRTKNVLRTAMHWYVERFAADVRVFNSASTRMAEVSYLHSQEQDAEIARLGDEIAGLVSGLERLSQRFAILQTRLRRTTLATPAAAGDSATAPAAPASNADAFDYFGFELHARGSVEDIQERQRQYLSVFEGTSDVLDIGCGRGEFLQLLGGAGIDAQGVDTNPDMVQFCQGAGLDVSQDDAVRFLTDAPDDSLGGLFAAQVVEHLPPHTLAALLEHALRVLRPDAPLVLETINANSLFALRHYFADLTHAQPLVPETLAFLVSSVGFRNVEVRYSSPVPDALRLTAPQADGLDPVFHETLTHNVERINDVVFAPQDFAVIARA